MKKRIGLFTMIAMLALIAAFAAINVSAPPKNTIPPNFDLNSSIPFKARGEYVQTYIRVDSMTDYILTYAGVISGVKAGDKVLRLDETNKVYSEITLTADPDTDLIELKGLDDETISSYTSPLRNSVEGFEYTIATNTLDITRLNRTSENVTSTDVLSVSLDDAHVNDANKLTTPRIIWGQSFDGTANIAGDITVGNIIPDMSLSKRNAALSIGTAATPFDGVFSTNVTATNSTITNLTVTNITPPDGQTEIITKSLIPDESNLYTVGRPDALYSGIYAVTLSGELSGNANSATKLQTPRAIWGQSFDGTAAISGLVTNAIGISNNETTAISGNIGSSASPYTNVYGTNLVGNATTATTLQTSRTLWGQAFNGNGDVVGNIVGTGSITPTATDMFDIGSSTNAYRTVYATTFSGDILGNAATATKLETPRTIAIIDGATGTATSFDGSGNITIPVTSLDASKLTGTASVNTTGSAATLTTGRTIGISGAVTGTPTSFNGSANITIPITELNVGSVTEGVLPIAHGGTGVATSTTPNKVFATDASVSSSTAPSFRSLVANDIPNLDAGKINSGLLPIARGGTALGSIPVGSILWGSATNTLTALVPSGANKVLRSTSATAIEWGNIISGDIADGTIATADLADGIITSAKIADDAVTSGKIAEGAVSEGDIASNAVTTAKIADGAITSSKIADGAVGSIDIADDAITSGKIAEGAVGTSDIAAGAVTTVKLADGSVTSAKIVDGAITTADIADEAITTSKIAEGAVGTSDIAAGAVTAVKIADGAITSSKIASSGVTAGTYRSVTVADNGTVTSGTNPDYISTIATGDANGTLSVSSNGGSAVDIAVKGLGSNAYTSTTYQPQIVAGASGNIVTYSGTAGTIGSIAQSTFATAAQGTKADNAIPASEKAANNGVATLTSGGKLAQNIAWSQVDSKPSYTGADILLTGYVQPIVSSAIVATDNANIAIGKLEKKVDDAVTGGLTSVSIVTGDANGQVKYNTNGGSYTNVSVKGLGDAAYTASTNYATAAQGITADNAIQKTAVVTSTNGYLATHSGTVGTFGTPVNPATFATSAQGAKADNAVVANIAITGAQKTKITYDSKGLVTSGADLVAADIPISAWAKADTKPTYTYGEVGAAPTVHSHTNYLSDLIVGTTGYSVVGNAITIPAYPTTLPASDVSAWAKQANKPTYTAAEVGAIATELDPTVKAWAKADTKPTYTASEVGAISVEADPTVKAWAKADAKPTYNASEVGAVASNTAIVAATKTKITYDAKGLVTVGGDLAASDIPSLTISKLSDFPTTWEWSALNGTPTWIGANKPIYSYAEITGAKPNYIGSEILLTGYAKAGSSAPVSATDNANVAIGKLERLIDDAVSGGVSDISILTGGANGTIKYSTNGGGYTDIAVKGLGSAAYTASTAYATSTQGTKADEAVVSNNPIIGAQKTKITYDSKGLVTSGTDLVIGDIPISAWAKAADKPTYTYTEVGAAASSHTHSGYLSSLTVGDIGYTVVTNGITIPAYPTTLPASDVYAWAKASVRPTYTASDVGAIATEVDPTVKAWAKADAKPTYTAAEVGAISVELDPTVSAWAKNASKPTYTANEVGAVATNEAIAGGTFKSVTVDAKGLVTGGTNPTTLAGYGITDAIPNSAKAAVSGVATLDASSKLVQNVDWANIDNKPTIPTVPSWVAGTYAAKSVLMNNTDASAAPTAVTMSALKTSLALAKGDVGLGNVANSLQVIAAAKGETGDKSITSGGTFKVLQTTAAGAVEERTMTIPVIPAAPVQSDWNEAGTGTLAYIKNKPTIPAAQIQSDWTQGTSSALDYIKNKPTIPDAQVQVDWNQTTTGAIDYIKNKPVIPSAYVLPVATASTLGGVKSGGANVSISAEGVISATNTVYTLPIAGAAIGGVKSGGNVTIDGTGQMTAPTYTLPAATASSLGGVKQGTNITIAGDGTISASGSASQVQSDWNQSSDVAVDYIKNKPTIPTVPSWVAGTYDANTVLMNNTASTAAPTAVTVATLKTTLGSMPASDVSAWAKEANKPTYSFSEITGTKPSYAFSEITGSVASSQLPVAGSTSATKGAVYAGTNITIDADGKINASGGGGGGISSVSLASGTNNGTVKLTVDATVTDNIAVKGLGSAAYTASTAYATSTQGTTADNAIPKTALVTSTNGYLATHSGTAGTFGTPVNPASFATSAQGTAADNAIPASQKAANNGVATLNATGKVVQNIDWANVDNKPSYVGSDILLTGYAKAGSAVPVAATDNVNVAIGKLERLIDDATSGGVSSVDVASGTTNGTIKFNTNGGAYTDVAVRGLDAAAYKHTGTSQADVLGWGAGHSPTGNSVLVTDAGGWAREAPQSAATVGYVLTSNGDNAMATWQPASGGGGGLSGGTTAGTAPVWNGTATSQNNYPLVMDGTTGKIKTHSSGALGSAAFANAGATSGYVPTWGSDPTTLKLVLTDSSGKLITATSGSSGQVLMSQGSGYNVRWSGLGTGSQYDVGYSGSTIPLWGTGPNVNAVTITDGSGWLKTVANGTSGYVLTSNGSGSAPSWQAGGGSSYTLPTASTSTLGGVKIDGTTITISSGVISAAGSSYSLPTASASTLGGIKVGSGLSISGGVLSASGGSGLPLTGGTLQNTTGSSTTTLIVNSYNSSSTAYAMEVNGKSAFYGSGYAITAQSNSSSYPAILCSSASGSNSNPGLEVTGTSYTSGYATFYSGAGTSSDARFKTNVDTVPSAMKYIKKLNIVQYDFNNQKGVEYHSFGVIAQDLEKLGGVYATMVHTDKDGYKSVDYDKFGVIAIKAIQEQNEVIRKQDSIIFQHNRSIDELKVEVVALRKVVTELYNIVKKK